MSLANFYCRCGWSWTGRGEIPDHTPEPGRCCNCGGQRCMDCAGRYVHDECVWDCPDCSPKEVASDD